MQNKVPTATASKPISQILDNYKPKPHTPDRGEWLQCRSVSKKRGSDKEFLVRRHPPGGALGDSVLTLKPVREIGPIFE